MTVAALYQLVARDNNTQEGSVAAAVVRLSQKMHRQNTGFYRQLCVRCGLPEDAVLPNGKLLKGMWELLRQKCFSAFSGAKRGIPCSRTNKNLPWRCAAGCAGAFKGPSICWKMPSKC